jgi:CxxC motif-containing protein (DUF1111 family)
MEPHRQARGPQESDPPTPLGAEALRCASAKASVGHPPASGIRRSMVDPLLKVFLFGVTHSSTAKAVPARRSACFRRNALYRQTFRHAGVVSCVGG